MIVNRVKEEVREKRGRVNGVFVTSSMGVDTGRFLALG